MKKSTPIPDLRTRLRELRKARGWTLTYVAETLGTTPQTISRLETNVMTVSTDWLQKFADLFGVAAADLISESGAGAIKVIGHVRNDGMISGEAPSPLPIRLAVDRGIAVKLDCAIGSYRTGAYLVANRLEGRNLDAAVGHNCIVENELGTLWLVKLIRGIENRFTLVPLNGGTVQYDQNLNWAARITLELRLLD